ncbi:MAG: hypothetical protein ACYDCK_13605 [Thermoplasmatota archaeon]
MIDECYFHAFVHAWGLGLLLPTPEVDATLWAEKSDNHSGSGMYWPVCSGGFPGSGRAECNGTMDWSTRVFFGDCTPIIPFSMYRNGASYIPLFVDNPGIQGSNTGVRYDMCRDSTGAPSITLRVSPPPPPPPPPPRLSRTIDVPANEAVVARFNFSARTDATLGLDFRVCPGAGAASPREGFQSFEILDGNLSVGLGSDVGTFTGEDMVAARAAGETVHSPGIPIVSSSPCTGTGLRAALGQWARTPRNWTFIYIAEGQPGRLNITADWTSGFAGYDIAIVPAAVKSANDFDQGEHASISPWFIGGVEIGTGLEQTLHTAHDFVGLWSGNTSSAARPLPTGVSVWTQDATCTENANPCAASADGSSLLASTTSTDWDFRINQETHIGAEEHAILVGAQLPDASYLSR